MLRALSIVALLLMVAAIIGLFVSGNLFSKSPIAISIQIGGFALVIWARATLGLRSFHAAADPTAGGIVTAGPYRYIRHPIYTGASLIGLGGAVARPSALGLLWGALLVLGGLVRMLCEERLLVRAYPEYRAYMQSTKRIVPGVF